MRPKQTGIGRRHGLSLVELMVALVVASLVIAGVLSVSLMVRKTYKAISSQQMALYRAKKSIELLNREIRRAEAPLLSLNGWGNSVDFCYYNETTVRRISLISEDEDISTPWDNSLVYDPNIATSGGEIVVATGLAPATANGAFNYSGGNTPLVVRMRVGDPVGNASVQHSSLGVQGVEINITVAPRNRTQGS